MPSPSSITLPGSNLLPGDDQATLALSNFARILYDELEPLRYADEITGYPLARFVNAIAAPFDLIWDLTMEVDVPWETIVDIDSAPASFLQWLGRFKGVNINRALSADEQRTQIHGAAGFARGTPSAIIAAARQTLTGNKYVFLNERDGGAYRLGVDTLVSETPDPAATLAAVLKQKPAGIVLTHNVIASEPVWDQATSTWDTSPSGMTWNAVGAGI